MNQLVYHHSKLSTTTLCFNSIHDTTPLHFDPQQAPPHHSTPHCTKLHCTAYTTPQQTTSAALPGGKGKAEAATEVLEGEGVVIGNLPLCLAQFLIGQCEAAARRPYSLLGMVEGLEEALKHVEVHVQVQGVMGAPHRQVRCTVVRGGACDCKSG